MGRLAADGQVGSRWAGRPRCTHLGVWQRSSELRPSSSQAAACSASGTESGKVALFGDVSGHEQWFDLTAMRIAATPRVTLSPACIAERFTEAHLGCGVQGRWRLGPAPAGAKETFHGSNQRALILAAVKRPRLWREMDGLILFGAYGGHCRRHA